MLLVEFLGLQVLVFVFCRCRRTVLTGLQVTRKNFWRDDLVPPEVLGSGGDCSRVRRTRLAPARYGDRRQGSRQVP